MRYTILLSFVQFLFVCNQYSTSANPIHGADVRIANELFSSCIVGIVALCERNNTITDPDYFHDDVACTGTLISKTHVLTAEHCATSTRENLIQIVVGSIDIRMGLRYNLMWWITHHQWRTTIKRTRYVDNDISIIKLLIPVPNEIVPARLSTATKRSLFGLRAGIAGWGTINNNIKPLILQEATVKIISDDECIRLGQRFGETNSFFPISELCSIGEPQAHLGSGDSGGPLLIGNAIVGVNIGLSPDLDENILHPGLSNLHASVHFYRNFINENTKT